MAAPPNSEFDPNNPNLLTDGDAAPATAQGRLKDPSIDFMGQQYKDAQIRVVDDLTQYNKNPTVPWVHDLLDITDTNNGVLGALGNATRDLPSSTDYWTVQIVGAFEGSHLVANTSSFDGWSPGPAYIFSRSAAENLAPLPQSDPVGNKVNLDTYLARAVFHESLHRFPDLPTHATPQDVYNIGDKGPMDYKNLKYGTDDQNRLTTDQVDLIEGEPGPG